MQKEKNKDKKKLSNITKLYSVEGEKVARKNKTCPKCGAGVFLAVHSDRVSCGRCGYTVFNAKR